MSNASGGVLKKLPEALASRNYMEDQRLMRVVISLSADFGFARKPCSERRMQILDNLSLTRDAVSAIN